MTARYLEGPELKSTARGQRLAFVTQMGVTGVAASLENTSIFLSPRDQTHNLRQRNQEIKPRTPSTEVKQEF